MTEQEAIDSCDSEMIYLYACRHPEANIELLQNAIIEAGNPYYMYHFARGIKGADIFLLQDAVIKSKHAAAIYFFANEVKRANRLLLGEAIKRTNDSRFIKKFIKLRIPTELKAKLKRQLVLAQLSE